MTTSNAALPRRWADADGSAENDRKAALYHSLMNSSPMAKIWRQNLKQKRRQPGAAPDDQMGAGYFKGS